MSEQPTAAAQQPLDVDQLVEMHDLYVRCIGSAIRQRRRGGPRSAVLATAGVEHLNVNLDALAVMAITTARFVGHVADELGIEPALLWRRFATAENEIVRNASRPPSPPEIPAEPGEDTR